MKGIPPEINELMWAVAEDPSPQAIEQFGERYPTHRGELMRRVNMVRGLRNEINPGTKQVRELPRFHPREPVQAPNPKGLMIAAVLGLAAVAAASYTVYSAFRPAPPPIKTMVVNRVPDQLPSVSPIIPKPPYVTPPPNQTFRPPQNDEEAPVPSEPPAYERPRPHVAIKDAYLADALSLVTAGSGIKLEIGPGFVDRKVSLDYRDMSTVDILQDMAKQYDFTVFDEGGDSFLILPAADNHSRTTMRKLNP